VSLCWYHPITCPCLISRIPSRILSPGPCQVLQFSKVDLYDLVGCYLLRLINAIKGTVFDRAGPIVLAPWWAQHDRNKFSNSSNRALPRFFIILSLSSLLTSNFDIMLCHSRMGAREQLISVSKRGAGIGTLYSITTSFYVIEIGSMRDMTPATFRVQA
jgi:hypothetical protein